MKKYVSILFTALAGGGLSFVLRLAQNRTGFEPDTGLPIPGSGFALAVPVVLAALAAATAVLCRGLPSEKEDTPGTFPDYFQARDTLTPTLLVTGAFLWLLSGGLELFTALAYRQGLVLGLVTSDGLFSPVLAILSGGLTLLSALALFPIIAACRTGGRHTSSGVSRRPLNSNLLLVPVAALVLRLVLVYREDSVNPSISAYYVGLLALAALILSFYRASSFGFHCGRTRRFAVYGLWALTLGVTALADSRSPASALLTLGGILLVTGLLLMRFAALAHEAAKSKEA
ncbi:hypothetical protein [Dysosmobacter sp.]|uniref:hypothetical protein n=1 Tax=Dysosmobacter sp. TaxID=2591382 RepID=UPI002A888E28|nr:hypothetical protein [Dysosmobacter sp.]MDY3282321.1 hypothetical protein [Dysosmobacter sp.]